MYYVQIISDVDQTKAVRFPFHLEVDAKAFAGSLSAAFFMHKAGGVIGCYKDGEKCPFGYGDKDATRKP